MKAKLKFDLDDQHERMEHFRCIKALDMALALYDLNRIMKKVEDNEDHLDRQMTAEQLKDFISRNINEILEDYNINIDELVS